MDGTTLYEVLGVREDAEATDITQAYRRLSRTYHPDRWLDPQEKQAAGERWLHISAAYDVLADERKRMAYDTLGPDQFALGLQVLQQDRVRGPEELRAAVWKRQRRAAEAEHQGRLRLSGTTVISTSVDDLAPSPPTAPWTRWLGPELQSVAMSQDMTLELGARSALTLGPQLLTKAGLGGSTLRLGFKRQLSAFASVDVGTTLLGGPAALSLSANRRLSRHSQGVLSYTLTPPGAQGGGGGGGGGGGLGGGWRGALALRATRQLTKRTLGC